MSDGPPPEQAVIRSYVRIARYLGMGREVLKRRVKDPADPLHRVVTFDAGDRGRPQALAADLDALVRTSPTWAEAR